MNQRIDRWTPWACGILLSAASFYGLSIGDVDDAEALRLEWLARHWNWQADPALVRTMLAIAGFAVAGLSLLLVRKLRLPVDAIAAAFALLLTPPILLWNGRDLRLMHGLAAFGIALAIGSMVHWIRQLSPGALRQLSSATVALAIVAAVAAALGRIATVHFFMERVQAFLLASLAAGAIAWRLRRQPLTTAVLLPLAVLGVSAKLLFVHVWLPERDQWRSARPSARATTRARANAHTFSDATSPSFRYYVSQQYSLRR